MRLQTRVPEQRALACLIVAAVLFAGFMIFGSPRVETASEILIHALEKLEEKEKYPLVIEEKATSYSLKFEGEIQNYTDLKGKIKDHGLEISRRKELLLVKPEAETDWQAAEELGLNSLNSFLAHPAEVLHALRENFAEFMFDPGIGGLQNIYYDTCSADKHFADQFFPDIPVASIDRLTVYMTLSEPERFLKEIKIELIFRGSPGSSLTRIYIVN